MNEVIGVEREQAITLAGESSAYPMASRTTYASLGFHHKWTMGWMHDTLAYVVRDLNALYRATPALYTLDFVPAGFEWIDHNDAAHSVLRYIRHGLNANTLKVVVCNITPSVWKNYRLGVPQAGTYRERLNTDAAHYGGSQIDSPVTIATAMAWQSSFHDAHDTPLGHGVP
jgi:1,4-alpha-glucan branching enzyme